MGLPDADSADRRHYQTDAGWRLEIVAGEIRVSLAAPSESALRGVGLAALDKLATSHWTNKAEVVPQARALGVSVGAHDTVASIKLAIKTAAGGAA